jgi:ABC-type uncharacterized transport system substrate-binding protein
MLRAWVPLGISARKKAASGAAQSFSRCFNQTSMIAMILWLRSTTFDVEVTPGGIRDASEIERVIEDFAREPNGGLIGLPSVVTQVHRDLVVRLAARHRLPTIYGFRYFPASGGLMSYGIDPADLFRRAASYIDRILNGAKVGELPVQAPTKYELVINLKTVQPKVRNGVAQLAPAGSSLDRQKFL